ncbi:NAD(P)H quinone oxidoreductase [Formosimonas limnophila]|uniref:NAD(P)H quinone oxidoreductase n=1 Tax=Formosimonas limnophila TaxID=1384487 RepID=A0A8J3FZU6_9BURK|nr:NAD(P)H-quinone oxidoreductase [Formosimonas limnophila]GHA77612.1 NAD(P)H quinone oxidoreductase [Formosimonas limnophila]
MKEFDTPSTMKAVICEGTGDASVLRIAELPTPNLPADSSGLVVIRVHAAGVNRPDILQRQGLYQPPPDASPILGLEVAGEIVGGDLVGTNWRVGDAVCALTHGGGYAQYVVVDARHCLPVPTGWSMVQAASLPETYFTVWFNLFQKARLCAGETLLVHAGASGIGVAAISLASALGVRVVATLGESMETKANACQSLGAALVVDVREVDWWRNVLSFTGGHGVNAVLDVRGGDTLDANIQVMAHGGRLVWLAFLAGNRTALKISEVMAKELVLTGSFLRRQSSMMKAEIAADLNAKVWPLMQTGAITPVLDSVFDMVDVQDAHRHMERNAHTGKIVLKIHDH